MRTILFSKQGATVLWRMRLLKKVSSHLSLLRRKARPHSGPRAVNRKTCMRKNVTKANATITNIFSLSIILNETQKIEQSFMY